MKLNAPKFLTWLIAVVLGVLGILFFADVLKDFLSLKQYAFWLVTAGFGLLTLGTFLKGL